MVASHCGALVSFVDLVVNWRGMPALVGDPWRTPLPTARLTELARYDVAEADEHTLKPSGVFAFNPSQPR